MLAIYAVVLGLVAVFVVANRTVQKAQALAACAEIVHADVPGVALDHLTADAARERKDVYRIEFSSSFRGQLMTWGCRARRMPEGTWAAMQE